MLALLAGLTCLLLVPHVAHADDVADEAELQFSLGAEKYQAGSFQEALAHFLASNRLSPNKNVVFNIARTYEQLRQFPEAFRYYSIALEAEAEAAGRAPIEAALARIRPSVAVLAVETSPPGATIFIDRKDLGARGATPRSLGFKAGTYRVIVERDGYEPKVIEGVVLETGKEQKLKLDLVPILGEVLVSGLPVRAEVRVNRSDGEPARVGPGTLSLPPGRQRLFISAQGAEPLDIEVDVKANERVTVRPTLRTQKGTLLVSTDVKGALVELDGAAVGFTPIVLESPIGQHKLKISLSGFRPIERTVQVTLGKEQRLAFDLLGGEEVTAVSRFAEAVTDAPSSVTIIDGRELRAFGYPTLAESLRGVRGVYLSDDRSYTSVGFRGFSRLGDYGNKVLILYDGLAANDNILGQSFPGFEGLTDLEDVERIEVVRGPGSSLYGTGAFFGVVNVVRHDAAQPSRAEATLSTAEGAFRARTMGYWGDGKESAIWGSASVARSAGRDFYFKEFADEPSLGFARDVDDFTAAMGQVRGFYKFFNAQAFFHQRTKTLPTGEYETLFGDKRHVWIDRRGAVEAKLEPEITDWLSSMTRAHGNFYSYEATFPYAEIDGGEASEDYLGVWAGLEQRFIFRPADFVRITVGGEGQRHFLAQMKGQDGSGVYLPDDPNPYWVGSGYAEASFDILGVATLVGGARIDGFAWEFPEPLGNVSRFSVNPRLSGVFKPYEDGILKVIAGKAFKAPSVYELFYQGAVQRPSPDLEPEEVYSGELEFTHLFSKVMSLTVAGYANYVTSLIVARGAGSEEDPLFLVNAESPVLAAGGEIEARRTWKDGWMFAASVSGQRSSYIGDDTGLRNVPNSPYLMASVRGVAPIVGDSLRIASRATLESGRYDRNETASDAPQTLTDATVIWDITLNGDVLDGVLGYVVGVYNAADMRQRVPVSGEFRQRTIEQNGRTFLASITARLR
ncbi:MAG: TonB-dependent receptor [Myxococcales bacterium]|nr:TonB-dependent receptor [Myxococcales bacterium]